MGFAPGAGSGAGFGSGTGLGAGFGTDAGAGGTGADSGAGTPGSTTVSGLPLRGTDHGHRAFGATGDAFADYTENPDRPDYGSFAEHPAPGSPADAPSGPGRSGTHGIPAPGGLDPSGPGGPSGDGRSGLYDVFEESAPPTGTHRAGPPGDFGPDVPAGAFDVTAALAAGPLGDTRGPRDSDLAYFPDDSAREAAPGPAGPTGGPVTGDSVLPARHRAVPRPDPVSPPLLTGDEVGLPPMMSDDTAVLTPQKHGDRTAPEDNVSGHTVTSGVPVVPDSGRRSPFGASGGPSQAGEPAMTHTPPKLPDTGERSAPTPQPRKKGGSKTVLLTGLLVVAAGGVYGAGLLMNHSDVPKGTVVLGVDIGGGTRDDAARKLDAAFGARTARTLQISVNGRSVPLKPDQAGLALDSEATVRAAAQNDYNPVTVIGTLFGGTRVVQPVMPVDEEKLRAALEHASGSTGSVTEGTITFEPGKAVAVYGRKGNGIDASKAVTTVEQAYRVQVEKGRVDPVQVPLAAHRPTVSNAEVDRMMREFARLAMSANVTVRAGDASIEFGPNKSLPQILGVKAVNGKLVDVYDRAAAKRLYGSTFDGVLITRANGKKTPVQVEDVLGAMRTALLGKTPAERVGVIELEPS